MKRSDFEEVKILIGVPSRGEFKCDMALSFAFMLHVITADPLIQHQGKMKFISWKVNCTRTSLLPQSRQAILDLAIEGNFDWLLMVDDDMIFDPRFLRDWMLQDKPAIAMNCPTRSIPCHATAREYDAAEPHKGKVVYSDVQEERFQRVWRVGTGIILLRADAMKALPRPAFTPRWEPGNDHYVGEDWVMMENLEAAGIPVVIDNEWSLSVKHVGDMEFTHEMAAGTRVAIEKKKASAIVLPPGLTVPS